MRFPKGCRLPVLAALVLVAATVLAPGAAAKGKKAACKGTKVAVKAGKKTTCQPFAKVFPSPKSIDTRLAYIQQTVKFDPASAVTGKKRKRVRKLQSSFRAAAKRAQAKLLKVAPKALAFIDKRGGGAGASSFPPGPALTSAGCHPGPAGPTGGFEGASMGMLGDNGGYMDVPIGHGLHARVTFVSCGGVTAFNIPECPTANGIVDGRGRGEFSVTFEIRSSSQVISRSTTNFEQKAKIHGEVGPDAKLKSIDVEHTEEVFIVATTQGYPIVVRGGVTRKVHIPMPGGHYDPASASARFFGDPLDAKSGAESFADTAKSAITSYQKAEERWSSFKQPYCADPVFDPDSNATKLKKGETGQLGIFAKARADGGRATEARWTLLGPLNADFSPTTSQDASPSIQYTVSKSPVGDQVKVTVKVTSTGGVGQKTWTEPIKPPGFDQVKGTFNGEVGLGLPDKESIQSWSGDVTLNHTFGATEDAPAAGIYSVESGHVVLQATGLDGSGITGCHQSGSVQGKITGGLMEVTPIGPEGKPPYEYSMNISMPFIPLEITRSNCPEAAKEFEGTTENIVPLYSLQPSGQESADGVTYSGTRTVSVLTEHWDLVAE